MNRRAFRILQMLETFLILNNNIATMTITSRLSHSQPNVTMTLSMATLVRTLALNNQNVEGVSFLPAYKTCILIDYLI